MGEALLGHSRHSEEHSLGLGSPKSRPCNKDLGAGVYLGGDSRELGEGVG